MYAYFHQALDLRSQYDLYSILKSAGITPGGEYSVSDFESAIESAVGVKPKITCDNNGQLEEIWLYFYVQGTSTYQPTDAVASSTCSGAIEYPAKN